jgi:endonuclease/exonuclease/phosphatase family metal-dependent hydrolase
MPHRAADAPRPLRLVSYNILKGGLGRLDPIYETLLYLRGDLVALVEADDAKGAAYLADKLGCEHVLAEANDKKHPVALLSRLPIQRMANLGVRLPQMERGLLEAVVHIGEAKSPLRVVVTHLPAGIGPVAEKKRMAVLAPLLQILAEEELPTVVMGDFNSDARWHPFDEKALSERRQHKLAEAGGFPAFEVADTMVAAGWVDAYHLARPKDSQPRHTLTTGFPAQRVDYIWVDAGLADRVAASDVETGGFAPYCSDHFPIWADLKFD